MSAATKQRSVLKNATIDGRKVSHGLGLVPNTAAGARVDQHSRPMQRSIINLSAFAVSVAAANDFGSTKLCDLPNTAILIVSCALELTGTVAGFTSDVGTAVDLALGTVATASAAFSNAGEKDLIPKIDGTGAGTTATIKGQGTTTEKLLFIAPGSSNAIYVNVADPVTTGTGILTLSGFVIVNWFDLDLAA